MQLKNVQKLDNFIGKKADTIITIARLKELDLNSYYKELSYFVTDTGSYDILLGILQLKKHYLDIDQNARTLKFSKCKDYYRNGVTTATYILALPQQFSKNDRGVSSKQLDNLFKKTNISLT